MTENFGFKKEQDFYINQLMNKWVKVSYQGEGSIGILVEFNDRIILMPSLIYDMPLSKLNKDDSYKIMEEPTIIEKTSGVTVKPVTKENIEWLLGHEIKTQEKNPNQLELF